MKFFSSIFKSSSMDARQRSYLMEEDSSFMNCIMKVNVEKRGWQKALRKVHNSTQGIRSFNMSEDGIIQMSGYAKPSLLMYTLGKVEKHLEVIFFEHGKCSSYLFGPDRRLFGGGVPRP